MGYGRRIEKIESYRSEFDYLEDNLEYICDIYKNGKYNFTYHGDKYYEFDYSFEDECDIIVNGFYDGEYGEHYGDEITVECSTNFAIKANDDLIEGRYLQIYKTYYPYIYHPATRYDPPEYEVGDLETVDESGYCIDMVERIVDEIM